MRSHHVIVTRWSSLGCITFQACGGIERVVVWVCSDTDKQVATTPCVVLYAEVAELHVCKIVADLLAMLNN